MSEFTRINTHREKARVKTHLCQVKQARRRARILSLFDWVKGRIKRCTIDQMYQVNYPNSRKGLKITHKRAWHSTKGRIVPIMPSTNGQDFAELVLELDVDLIDRVAITVLRANVSYWKGAKTVGLPRTIFTNLGQIVICAPETQSGRCVFCYGFTGLSAKDIRQLLKDLKIAILFSSQEMADLPPEFPKVEGIEKHTEYAFGRCMLG